MESKQLSFSESNQIGRTTGKRIATRSLVTIGQVWERRSRKRQRPRVTIRQVHRGPDREVLAEFEDGTRQRIKFADLREKWRLVESQDGKDA